MPENRNTKRTNELSKERARELCRKTVENIGSIEHLLCIGFKPHELVETYGYDAAAVGKAYDDFTAGSDNDDREDG